MYRVGCCSGKKPVNGVGLGAQNLEDPATLKTDFDRAYQVFMATMNRLPAQPSADLVQRATILSNWIQSASSAMASSNWHDARVKINTIYGLLGDFSARVGQATVAGKTAQTEAESGSSFLRQVGVLLGVTPSSGTYVPDVPGSKAADLFGIVAQYPWAIPAGAGLLLYLLLKR